MSDLFHISSLLVRADPARLVQVRAAIELLPLAEIALCDPSGKIIVTLETPDESEIVDTVTRLQLLDGVTSAVLVFHQNDAGPGPAQTPNLTGGHP